MFTFFLCLFAVLRVTFAPGFLIVLLARGRAMLGLVVTFTQEKEKKQMARLLFFSASHIPTDTYIHGDTFGGINMNIRCASHT